MALWPRHSSGQTREIDLSDILSQVAQEAVNFAADEADEWFDDVERRFGELVQQLRNNVTRENNSEQLKDSSEITSALSAFELEETEAADSRALACIQRALGHIHYSLENKTEASTFAQTWLNKKPGASKKPSRGDRPLSASSWKSEAAKEGIVEVEQLSIGEYTIIRESADVWYLMALIMHEEPGAPPPKSKVAPQPRLALEIPAAVVVEHMDGIALAVAKAVTDSVGETKEAICQMITAKVQEQTEVLLGIRTETLRLQAKERETNLSIAQRNKEAVQRFIAWILRAGSKLADVSPAITSLFSPESVLQPPLVPKYQGPYPLLASDAFEGVTPTTAGTKARELTGLSASVIKSTFTHVDVLIRQLEGDIQAAAPESELRTLLTDLLDAALTQYNTLLLASCDFASSALVAAQRLRANSEKEAETNPTPVVKPGATDTWSNRHRILLTASLQKASHSVSALTESADRFAESGDILSISLLTYRSMVAFLSLPSQSFGITSFAKPGVRSALTIWQKVNDALEGYKQQTEAARPPSQPRKGQSAPRQAKSPSSVFSTTLLGMKKEIPDSQQLQDELMQLEQLQEDIITSFQVIMPTSSMLLRQSTESLFTADPCGPLIALMGCLRDMPQDVDPDATVALIRPFLESASQLQSGILSVLVATEEAITGLVHEYVKSTSESAIEETITKPVKQMVSEWLPRLHCAVTEVMKALTGTTVDTDAVNRLEAAVTEFETAFGPCLQKCSSDTLEAISVGLRPYLSALAYFYALLDHFRGTNAVTPQTKGSQKRPVSSKVPQQQALSIWVPTAPVTVLSDGESQLSSFFLGEQKQSGKKAAASTELGEWSVLTRLLSGFPASLVSASGEDLQAVLGRILEEANNLRTLVANAAKGIRARSQDVSTP